MSKTLQGAKLSSLKEKIIEQEEERLIEESLSERKKEELKIKRSKKS
jgi:hypothetical protein